MIEDVDKHEQKRACAHVCVWVHATHTAEKGQGEREVVCMKEKEVIKNPDTLKP